MARVSTTLCVALGLALVASAVAQSIYSDEFELVVESNKKVRRGRARERMLCGV